MFGCLLACCASESLDHLLLSDALNFSPSRCDVGCANLDAKLLLAVRAGLALIWGCLGGWGGPRPFTGPGPPPPPPAKQEEGRF